MRLLLVVVVALSGCAYKLDRDRGITPGEIQGVVVRTDDGNKPASFAKIAIPGSQRVTRALKDGSFRIQGLPPGPVAVTFADDADGDGRAERAGIAGATLPVDPDGKVGFVLLGKFGITGTMTIKGNVKIDDGTGNSVAPFAENLVARVFVTRGECFAFSGDSSTQTDCTTADPSRIELGAEAVTSADSDGNFELDGVTAGSLQLSVILTQNAGATVGGTVDVSLPVAVTGKAGDTVTANPIVFTGVAQTLGTRIVTIAPNPPAQSATVVMRTAGLGSVNCSGNVNDIPVDALVFDHVITGGAEAALSVPFGAYDVTVCGDDGLSGTSPAQLALPPTSDLDVPRWSVLRFDGDPCVHVRGARPVVDCDDDNVEAIPPLTPANVDLYTACIAACSLKSDGSFTFQGKVLDCDDDADGQPDCTEPAACQGPGKGTDLDGDFSCTFQDPSPTCTSNDPTQCLAGTNDVAPGDPTHPPIPLPGIWIPGPSLPSGTTAGDVVVMPFVQSGVGGPQLIGFAIANTKTNGTVDDTALGFRFATQQFETLPILGTLAPFFGAATALIPAPFGATAAVGGIDAGDGSTVLATARLMNAFAGDGPAGVSVQQAALPGVTAFGAVGFVLGVDPTGFPDDTARFSLAGGIDQSGNPIADVFVVDEIFVSSSGSQGVSQQFSLSTARKNLRAVSLEIPPRILFLGGEDATGPLGAMDVLNLDDLTNLAVEAAPSLSIKRTAFTATGSLLDVVVAGGKDETGKVLDSIERVRFDTSGNITVSTSAAKLAHARSDHAATLLDPDHVLITGGFDDAGAPVAAAELYSFSQDAIEELAPQNSPRGDHQAIPLAGGRVMVVGGKSAPAGSDVGTTEIFTPLGAGEGEGEGEGEGFAGEGEGEGSQFVQCATASNPASPAHNNSAIVDEVVANGVVFFVDSTIGVVAAPWTGSGFGATSVVVQDGTVIDVTFANGFVVASSPSAGVVYTIDPTQLGGPVDTANLAQVNGGPGFAPVSTLSLGPAGSFGFNYVTLDGNTHSLESFDDGDGILDVREQTRSAGDGDGNKLWFVDDGAGGQVVVENLGNNGGYDAYSLTNAFPGAPSLEFKVGAGNATMLAFSIDTSVTPALSLVTQSQPPPSGQTFPFSDVNDNDVLVGSPGTTGFATNDAQIEGAQHVGRYLVMGGVSFSTGQPIARVADVSTPHVSNTLEPDLPLAAGTDVVRAYALDASHVLLSGGAVIDLSVCP